MARYLYGMLQDCTVYYVPVVNKEPFYKKKTGDMQLFAITNEKLQESDRHLSVEEWRKIECVSLYDRRGTCNIMT